MGRADISAEDAWLSERSSNSSGGCDRVSLVRDDAGNNSSTRASHWQPTSEQLDPNLDIYRERSSSDERRKVSINSSLDGSSVDLGHWRGGFMRVWPARDRMQILSPSDAGDSATGSAEFE